MQKRTWNGNKHVKVFQIIIELIFKFRVCNRWLMWSDHLEKFKTFYPSLLFCLIYVYFSLLPKIPREQKGKKINTDKKKNSVYSLTPTKNIFSSWILCFCNPTCHPWRPKACFHVLPTYYLSSLTLKRVTGRGGIKTHFPYPCSLRSCRFIEA